MNITNEINQIYNNHAKNVFSLQKEEESFLNQKHNFEKYYQQWIDLAKSGVGVHCGECGCWNNQLGGSPRGRISRLPSTHR